MNMERCGDGCCGRASWACWSPGQPCSVQPMLGKAPSGGRRCPSSCQQHHRGVLTVEAREGLVREGIGEGRDGEGRDGEGRDGEGRDGEGRRGEGRDGEGGDGEEGDW